LGSAFHAAPRADCRIIAHWITPDVSIRSADAGMTWPTRARGIESGSSRQFVVLLATLDVISRSFG
jgi:hypothetical protein